MNPVVQLALNAALKYLESHPDQIEALVTAAIDALVKEFAKPKA